MSFSNQRVIPNTIGLAAAYLMISRPEACEDLAHRPTSLNKGGLNLIALHGSISNIFCIRTLGFLLFADEIEEQVAHILEWLVQVAPTIDLLKAHNHAC